MMGIRMGLDFFGGKGQAGGNEFGQYALPNGHTTVNASTVEQGWMEVKETGTETILRGQETSSNGVIRMITSLDTENSDRVITAWKGKGDHMSAEGRDLYQDIVAKGEWANNIAKRVRSSPDDLISELQLLEAQVARAAVAAEKARQVAEEKAREAAAATREAEAATAAGEYLQQQLEQCRLRLAQQKQSR